MEIGPINDSFITGFAHPHSPEQVEASASKQSVFEEQQGVRLQTEKYITERDDEELENELDVTPVVRETEVSDL